MKKIVNRIYSKIEMNIRRIRGIVSIRMMGDGDFGVDFPVLHRSLQPSLSADYERSKEQVGDEIAEKWSQDGCGVASATIAVDSILRSRGATSPMSAVTLLCEKHRGTAYIPGIGWLHKGLVSFAESYGVNSFNCACESYESICYFISKGWLAVSSVTLYFKGGQKVEPDIPTSPKRKKGGHLVVLKGFKVKDKRVVGFFVDDCQNIELKDGQESDEFVPIDRFLLSYSMKSVYFR